MIDVTRNFKKPGFQDESVETLSDGEPKFENAVREILPSPNCSSRTGALRVVIAPSGSPGTIECY